MLIPNFVLHSDEISYKSIQRYCIFKVISKFVVFPHFVGNFLAIMKYVFTVSELVGTIPALCRNFKKVLSHFNRFLNLWEVFLHYVGNFLVKRKCVVVFSKLVGIFPTLLVSYAGNFLTKLNIWKYFPHIAL